MFNVDGAPKFESSTWSAWPVYLLMNELPPKVRLRRLVTLGFWFAKSKPPMNAFLTPVFRVLNELSSMGVECMIKDPTKCPKKEDLFGGNNASQFSNLDDFDIIGGFIPDYMHNSLINVGEWVTELLLKILSATQRSNVNTILEDLAVPHQLALLSRPLSCQKQWKAEEWENFILYYSLPVFKPMLEKRYFDYWKLFVESLHTLLKKRIHSDEIDQAELDLRRFIHETEEYFGIENMTAQSHLLGHLPDSGVNLQIARYINIQRSIISLENEIYPDASPMLVEICQRLNMFRSNKMYEPNEITYLGNETKVNADVARKYQDFAAHTYVLSRTVKDDCLYTSSEKKNKRSNNCFARLKDGSFISIVSFLVDCSSRSEVTWCNKIRVGRRLSQTIFEMCNACEETSAVNTYDIDYMRSRQCMGEAIYCALA
ncbi:hypothetical protein QAD02_002241 [Eretmocerus hayati]|uniref:Uncharacterized protein n=1 Tax=Eretmocerus hayati TaxID=131215 RepID=A0ACC2NIQ7_9HYME|nr:hypothetical protein QAD02_002241 [Eretmocerus hayati]